MTEFDQKNHWIIDRGNGQPSVNIVVLSFVHPVRLMNRVNDAQTVGGVPIGMNQAVVDYFKTRGIRVMLSIGGITYTDAWNQALDTDPVGLAMAASDAANRLGVGIEIDYEENSSPRLAALQTFVDIYRALHPYDPTGSDPTARLTIDFAAGDRWLIDIARKATSDWLATATPVLDYANAMVPSRQPNSASTAQSNWQEHVDGKPPYSPPILPLAPAKFTGSLDIVTGNRAAPEGGNFALGEDHRGAPGGVRGRHLLLQPADGQHVPLQRDLARHAHRALEGTPGEERRERRDHGHAGAGPILGDGSRRHVHVELPAVEGPLVDAELGGVALDVGEGDPSGFLHDVAQLPGEHQAALAGHGRRLHEEDVSARAGDGEPGGHAGDARACRDLLVELRSAQRLHHPCGIDDHRRRLTTGGDARGRPAQHGAELALQLTDTR